MQVRTFRQQALAIAVAAAFQPTLLAQTLPSGFSLGAGQATPSYSPGHLQIEQASHKAILNWESFSIGAGGTVNFNQHQGSSSVALNRVLGNNPSQIFGNLSANGRVFLVNPSGILFGPGSSVNVGALVASTLSITDDDFLAGRYVFSNAGGAGGIVNQGSLFSQSGYTALLAPQVTNEGFIFANLGSVALAAGDRVTLDMVGDNLIRVSVDQATLDAAVVNRGSIDAFGGNVLLSARSANALLDTVLNTQGFVRAGRMVAGQDGEIVLDAGSRGTMAVGGQVVSEGHMSIAAADVAVSGLVLSFGGQNVAARSLSVAANEPGGGASLASSGGDQLIAISGNGASAGIDVIAAGGGFASISHSDPAFVQRITVTDADHINVEGRDRGDAAPFPASAGIFAGNSMQVISITGSGRNAITIGSEGATGSSVLNGLSQDITAGVGSQAGSFRLTGTDATNAFAGVTTNSGAGSETQTVSTSGQLSIIGGRAVLQAQNTPVGIFHNRQGQQTIRAANLEVSAGGSGANNSAFINVNGGADQRIEVAGGEIRVISGQGGANNTAGIGNQSSGNQTIVGNPDIFVAGGATSSASIQAGLGRTQTIEAHNITLTNGVDSAGNSAGAILAPHQRIKATGDVVLIARSGTGNASGARIGGLTNNSATDLLLEVDGNLTLTGGTAGLNGTSLGGTASGTSASFDNFIVVSALGDIVLDGAAGGAGVRIGNSPLVPLTGGSISVTGRSIRFTGTAPAAIRTLGNVELHAGEISQAANGLILANQLTTTSDGSTNLGGANRVATFNATSGLGDVALNNSGALEVIGLSARNAALANAGPVTISGWWNTFGDTSIATTGSGSDLLVTNSAFANGAMNVDVAGTLAVIAANGGNASLGSGGHQSIAVSGGNLEVLASAGGFAMVDGGSQSISILDGDYVRIAGDSDGFAQVISFNGAQTLSLTGSGDNAIIVGRQGGSGFSTLNAATQNITAGLGGQSGSITILGPDAGMFPSAAIATRSDGGQTISASGPIRVLGGSASFGAVGFFNDGPGGQTITAGSIELRGGPAGSGFGGSISSNGGGDQLINVAGDIEVLGGTGRNVAIVVNPFFSSRPASQTISAANIRVLAGTGGNATIATNTTGGQTVTTTGDIQITGGDSGIAAILAVGVDAAQAIHSREISLKNVGSGGNSVAIIQGSHQRITASGDVTLTASSAAGELVAARIGGATDRATDLELTVGGDLVLIGGTAGLNGAALGGSMLGAVLDNDITVSAAGDLVLDGGAGGGGARIGSSPRIGLSGGDIAVTARNIRFTGTSSAAIRTAGNVELTAGEITQGANGVVVANALTTQSQGPTLLAGANQVSSFSGSANGDLFLRNTSPFLTLGPVSASGALSIDQAGALLIQATDVPMVVRGGLVNVATGGDFRLVGGNADGAHALLSSGRNIDLTVGGTLRLDDGNGKFSPARIQTETNDGVINLAFPNLSSGGFYVNGVEGDTRDGKSGFFIFHKPARIGRDLLLEYQE
jgi:filamentous hemagglutinin family protein